MKHCSFCGNKHNGNKHNGNYMIFNNVPSFRCEYCGEKYYESKILKQIEREFIAVQNGKIVF